MQEKEKRFNKIAYDNAFIAKNYDRVNLTFPKGEKEKIKAAADAVGMSVNGFIQEAVREKMNK